MTDEEKAAAAAAEKAAAEKKAAEEAAKVAAEKAAAEKAAAEEAAKKKAEEDKNKSDEQKKLEELQAKIAKQEEALKSFEGIDPEVAKANAAKLAEAEKTAKEAEKAKAKAEGDFEKLATIQKEEREAELQAIVKERDEALAAATAAQTTANSAAISVAFSNSDFLKNETILTGPKAEKLYNDYVEVEEGHVIVYDSPAGAPGRARVMNSNGKSLTFNEAIQKVVESDPDKDSLLRSKAKPGPGTTTEKGRQEEDRGDRLSRMAKGLEELKTR